MTGTFVGMPAVPGRRTRGARRHPAAPQPRPRDRRRSAASAPRVVAEVADWEDLRAAGAAVKDETRSPDLDEHLLAARGVADRARRHGPLGARRRGGVRGSSRTWRAGPRRRRGRQGQVDGHPGDRPQRGACRGRGIAAWETDLAELIVQLGDDLPSHILVPGDPPQPRRDPRHLPRRMADAGRPAPDDLTDDPAELAGGRAAAPAREVPARQGRRLRRQLRRRRDRHARASSSPRATAGCA